MIKLHRENVTEQKYKKWDDGKFETATGRKVFRYIHKEFTECYQELLRFSKFVDPSDIIQSNYKQKLQKIVSENKLDIDIIEMAQIDIALCIVYFGVSKESEPILSHNFKLKYKSLYIRSFIRFVQLKPKRENIEGFTEWISFLDSPVKDLEKKFNDIYNHRRKALPVAHPLYLLFQNFKKTKYYGGHQHRLGHYFRHLFQAYKF